MKKCSCNSFRTAKSCAIHKNKPASHKFLKKTYIGMGVNWLAEEVIKLNRKLRKYEKNHDVEKGNVGSNVIDNSLSN